MAETVGDRQQLIFFMGRVLVIHAHVRRTKRFRSVRITIIIVYRITIDILHIHRVFRTVRHLTME